MVIHKFIFISWFHKRNNSFVRKKNLQWKKIFIQFYSFFFSQSTKNFLLKKLLFDCGPLGKKCKSHCYFVHFYVEFVELLGHEGWEMWKNAKHD